MTSEPKALQEIHEIRIKIYEETKEMTPEERTALARKKAQALIDHYGLNVKTIECPK